MVPCCCSPVAMVTAVCQSQQGPDECLIFSSSSGGGGASEPATHWELHPLSLLLSFLHQSDFSSPPPPPILPQRVVYESRWIVGNKSSTLWVFVINSVKWTLIIIGLQRRNGQVWILPQLFHQSLDLLHLLIVYWHLILISIKESDCLCNRKLKLNKLKGWRRTGSGQVWLHLLVCLYPINLWTRWSPLI